VSKTLPEVWKGWLRAGVPQQFAKTVRAEWDLRFPGVAIDGEQILDGVRQGGIRVKPDRTGWGDFIRVLVRSGRGHALRVTYYPEVPRGQPQAHYHETHPFTLVLDGEHTCTLAEFQADNDADLESVALVEALTIDESIILGGGAVAEMHIQRVS